MITTRFTTLVGCDVPLQLAPMGPLSTPALAHAVIQGGGHAMIGLANSPLPVASALLDDLEVRGLRQFGINFLIPFVDPECLAMVASRAPVVDFYLGQPDAGLVDVVHRGGALAGWQVTSSDEAKAAEAAGCDFIIVHGIEAGGRIPGGVSLFPLLALVLDEVNLPVVAAGGIATARGIAAALAAGADAVRMGTRFLATPESGAHPAYVEALLNATAEDTVYTEAFSALYPSDLPGSRVLRSSITAAEALADEPVGEMQVGAQRVPVPRFSAPPPMRETTGNIAAMALYAGESVGAVTDVTPATVIVRRLAGDAERLLRRWS